MDWDLKDTTEVVVDSSPLLLELERQFVLSMMVADLGVDGPLEPVREADWKGSSLKLRGPLRTNGGE